MVGVNSFKSFPEQNKLQDKKQTDLKSKLPTKADHTKVSQSKMNTSGTNYNGFKRQKNKTGVKELRKAKISVKECVESSLKAFGISLN